MIAATVQHCFDECIIKKPSMKHSGNLEHTSNLGLNRSCAPFTVIMCCEQTPILPLPLASETWSLTGDDTFLSSLSFTCSVSYLSRTYYSCNYCFISCTRNSIRMWHRVYMHECLNARPCILQPSVHLYLFMCVMQLYVYMHTYNIYMCKNTVYTNIDIE